MNPQVSSFSQRVETWSHSMRSEANSSTDFYILRLEKKNKKQKTKPTSFIEKNIYQI